MMAVARAELRRMVEALPDEDLEAARDALAGVADPMITVLDAAPLDTESVSEEERRQIAESERGIAEGRPLLTTAELEAEIETARA